MIIIICDCCGQEIREEKKINMELFVTGACHVNKEFHYHYNCYLSGIAGEVADKIVGELKKTTEDKR